MQPDPIILLIDDSIEDRTVYRRFLAQETIWHYQILEAESGEAGLQLCQQQVPDMILLDYRLPDLNGLEFLEQLQQLVGQRQLPVLMLTGQGNEVIAVQAMKYGVQDYLMKDHLTSDSLCQVMRQALQRLTLVQQLEQTRKQQNLVASIALQIGQSLHLADVLQATVTGVQQLFGTDRVLVYQFHLDWTGAIVAEAVGSGWTQALGQQVVDTCFQTGGGERYQQGHYTNYSDIYQAGLTDCHVALLERFEVKANLVVPILISNGLWGLLIAHQCSRTRVWRQEELELLDQLSVQVAIAIHQAELYTQAQREIAERQATEVQLKCLNEELELRVQGRTNFLREANTQLRREMLERHQVEQTLRQQTEQQRLVAIVTQRIRESLDLKTILNTAVTEIQSLLKADRVLVYRVWPDGTGSAIAEAVQHDWTPLLGFHFSAEVFPVESVQEYQAGRIYCLRDLRRDGVRPCLVDFLQQFQVKAKLVVPIIQQNLLWGLLIAHQCQGPRNWQNWEIDLLSQIANQLAIAVQQSALYEQLQTELAEHKETGQQLKHSLQEKEVLLKEIHHRVKNNLQIVTSLLKLQTSYIHDPAVREIFAESRNRVKAMAMIHEKLYQSDDLARADFAEYIRQLGQELLASYTGRHQTIQVQTDIERIYLGIDTAIPCGLIVNELVSNALKYAFPARSGEVRIQLHRQDDNHYELVIRDNGIGFPETIDFQTTASLGLQLVCSLTQQLQGTIRLNRAQGTEFTIAFSEL